MSSHDFTADDVARIAELARIPVDKKEAAMLAKGFTTTIEVIDKLSSVDVSKVPPTHQVTGLENILREDMVDNDRMFSQDEATKNAPRVYNGYFVVDQVLEGGAE